MLRSCSALLILTSLIVPIAAHAQDKPAGFLEFNEFAAKPLEGWAWDEDERLQDLIVQLQETELSLQALDAGIAKALGRKAGTKMDENMAWRSNLRMDLNAGGPIRWDAFYGRNAEKFFYHPTDRNSSYHTTTVLGQVAPTKAGGVAGNQGAPAHQRPPQFDYIYRGYEEKQKKAQADARALANKIEEMKSRRRQLESEIVLLWVKIAFRVLDDKDVAKKADLRWAAVPANAAEKDGMNRAAAFNASTRLLATALLFNEDTVESEPDKCLGSVKLVIKKSRDIFNDSLIRLGPLLEESDDESKPLGKYKRIARALEETSEQLSEGHAKWKDGDNNDDEPMKFNGLRRIQDSVVNYSQILLALNELVGLMKKEWGLTINTDGSEFVPMWDVAYKPRAMPDAAKPLGVPRGRRTKQELQKSLRGTLWKNTNDFVFEWDIQGRVWHSHKDNPNERFPVVIAYKDGDSCRIVFVNAKVQTVVFADDLQTLKQMTEDGKEVLATAMRIR